MRLQDATARGVLFFVRSTLGDNRMISTRHWILAGCGLLTAVMVGCNRSGEPSATSHGGPAHQEGQHVALAIGEHKKLHTHENWWCEEHGVPEEICGQCNAKLAADFQRKGDWCEKHERPDSQCFICHPEYEAHFAAQYEARIGTKPPKPQG
jgi:hypothetical protein